MELSRGTIPEQTLATYKIAMSLDSFTEENFGSEILHGAIQENANWYCVFVNDLIAAVTPSWSLSLSILPVDQSKK